jgi:ElaB/YqjD/DUF883 family membrane-anchored ribosome-binding protein
MKRQQRNIMEHRPDNPYEKSGSTADPAQSPRSASTSPTSGTGGGVSSAYSGGDNDNDQSAIDMVGRVAQGAHGTIDKLADRATPHVQRLQDGYHETEQLVQRKADHAREKAHEWTDSLRGSVREHPLTALATAVAAGMLLSRLTR